MTDGLAAEVEEAMGEVRATVPVSYQEAGAIKFAAEGLESVLAITRGTPDKRRVVEHNIAQLRALYAKIVEAGGDG
jgi:hypothetical protein